VSSATECINFKEGALNLIRGELSLFDKYREIRHRQRDEWFHIYVQRYTVIFINLLLIVGSIIAVYWLTLNDTILGQKIASSDSMPSFVKNIGPLVPNFLITGIVSVMPYIIRAATSLESYDFKNQATNQQIIRIYLVSVVSYLIYITIQLEIITGLSIVSKRDEADLTIPVDASTESEEALVIIDCKEDLASFNLMTQFIIMFFTKVATISTYVFIYRFVLSYFVDAWR
jgi:hypothetical protein